MKGNGISYTLTEGFKYFWSHRLMSVASISVLTVCLFIIGSFYAIMENVKVNIREFESGLEAFVILDGKLSEREMLAMESDIEALPNVDDAIYISKEQALKEFTDTYTGQAPLLEGMENPLTGYYRVYIKDASLMRETLYQLESMKGITRINSPGGVADKLVGINRVLTIVGALVMVLLVSVSLFIIVNTIKLARFVHRKEINIMKYVGATNWFIRWPFIIEGGLIGLVAGLLAYFGEWYVYTFLIEKISDSAAFIAVIPFSGISQLFLWSFVGAGLLVGTAGSAITIRKYLDV